MMRLETACEIISQWGYVVEQALACRTQDFFSYSSCSVLKFQCAEILILLPCFTTACHLCCFHY